MKRLVDALLMEILAIGIVAAIILAAFSIKCHINKQRYPEASEWTHFFK